MSLSQQISLFESVVPPACRAVRVINKSRLGTFVDNMKLPIHRWFRYSAGFSAEWVVELVDSFRGGRNICVLDPFAGSGTTLLAAAEAGASAVGFESHPLVAEIARAKTSWHKIDTDAFIAQVSESIASAKRMHCKTENAAPLLRKCYTTDALAKLLALKAATRRHRSGNDDLDRLVWLALTAILRASSHVGTAQWQYVLPNKRKAKVFDPFDALIAKSRDIVDDIKWAREMGWGSSTRLMEHDARQASTLAPGSVDLVVTSPPYPNNFDYADATRLEMTFWGEIDTWGDLQKTVRRHIIRSCSQHTAAERLELDALLALDEVGAIREELAAVCRTLETVRLTRGGRKTYHTMIAAYYADLSKVFRELRPLCATGSKLCFVIGDSAPYGVHAPADRWLARLAEDAGFHAVSFEKLRDRNTKWKNRKHTVPLHEGRLWFEG